MGVHFLSAVMLGRVEALILAVCGTLFVVLAAALVAVPLGLAAAGLALMVWAYLLADADEDSDAAKN